MLQCHRCSKGYICAILLTVTYIVCFNILTVHQLSKSEPDHFVHVYGTLYVGPLNGLKNWTCRPIRLSNKELPVTALASYPGSGNTWLRHLLQQATGIATGSQYVDLGLKYRGFPGEGISNGSVLTVKTHESADATLKKYAMTILLVRKPEDAMLAEFNRRYGGHLGHAQKIHFQTEWKKYLYEEMERWYAFNTRWLRHPGLLKIIRYDSLQQDTKNVLKSVLDFLNITVDDKDLSCVIKNAEGVFKRPGTFHNFSGRKLFTASETRKLVKYWNHILEEYGKRNRIMIRSSH